MGRDPLDTGGTSVDSNVSTPLILNEEKLDMADLPGQQSAGCLVLTGCPVLETKMRKSETMTSVTGRGAVGSQLLSQPLAFTNISVLSEADSPWAGEGLERKETMQSRSN